MNAQYITHGLYHDWYCCPSCDEEMAVLVGEDQAECPNPECGKRWKIDFDYSFEDGNWRNCSTISEKVL